MLSQIILSIISSTLEREAIYSVFSGFRSSLFSTTWFLENNLEPLFVLTVLTIAPFFSIIIESMLSDERYDTLLSLLNMYVASNKLVKVSFSMPVALFIYNVIF